MFGDDEVLILQFSWSQVPNSGAMQWQAWRWQLGQSILYTPDVISSPMMPTDGRKVYLSHITSVVHVREDGLFIKKTVDLECELPLEHLELEFTLQPRHDGRGLQWQANKTINGIVFQFIPDDQRTPPAQDESCWSDCNVSKIVHQSPDGRFCIAAVMRMPAALAESSRRRRRRYARRGQRDATSEQEFAEEAIA